MIERCPAAVSVTDIAAFWGAGQCASMQTLVTRRLRLEPLVVAHADALYPVLCDPRQLEYLDQGAPVSLEALRERYRKLESRRSPDGLEHWLNWAIVMHGGHADAVGFVQATVLADGRAWVAYEVAHGRWGQGLTTEATQTMIEHLFSQYAVSQCVASVDRRNARSWRLLERLEFAQAGATQAAAMAVQAGDWLYLRCQRLSAPARSPPPPPAAACRSPAPAPASAPWAGRRPAHSRRRPRPNKTGPARPAGGS